MSRSIYTDPEQRREAIRESKRNWAKRNPESARKWKQANPEKVKEYTAKYRRKKGINLRTKLSEEEKIEHRKATSKKWNAAHPDKMKEATRKYLDKTRSEPRRKRILLTESEKKERLKVAVHRWQQANPEKVKEYNQKWRKNHPRKMKKPYKKRGKLRIAKKQSLDLESYKDNRNTGKFIHKMPFGTNGKVAKAVALKDITEDCRSGIDYTKNYISRESLVLQLLEYPLQIIRI
jgi:hypothetical protein